MQKIKNKSLPAWAIGVISLSFILNILFFALMIVFAVIDTANDIEQDLSINKTAAFYNEEYQTYTVTGIMQNISNYDYEYVTIEYTLYDIEGNIIGVAEDYIDELDEKEKWRFSAEYYGINAKEISYYEMTLLEGY